MDYLSQYDQETYIFETVRRRFADQGFLNAYDFFCIIIWKANRAKTKIAQRLLKINKFDTLDDAVKALSKGIITASEHKERLHYLLNDWGFQLPMATAILTALYPDYFTVYDVRVCDELQDFHNLKNMVNFENIWTGFLAYKQQVELAASEGLSLRDKDRYLWGRSFSRQLENDIRKRFSKGDKDNE
ncbi:hypothetical protein [Paenibacillus sp. GYB003]|uniref:hypothetical protein n=1 Tax=Paenibacillus sp. GYB003 TaxID=2994392 RepID=UPI002F96D6D5